MKAKYIVKTFAIIAAISNIQAVRLLAFTRKTKITPDVHISDKIKPTPIIAGSNMNSNETNSNVNPEETDQNTKPTDNEFTYSLDQTKPKINKKLIYSGAAVGGVALIALVATLAGNYILGKSQAKPIITPHASPDTPMGNANSQTQGHHPESPSEPGRERSETAPDPTLDVTSNKPANEPKSTGNTTGIAKPTEPSRPGVMTHPSVPTAVMTGTESPPNKKELKEWDALQQRALEYISDPEIARSAVMTVRIPTLYGLSHIIEKNLIPLSNGRSWCFFMSILHMFGSIPGVMHEILQDTTSVYRIFSLNDPEDITNGLLLRAMLYDYLQLKRGRIHRMDIAKYQNYYKPSDNSSGGDHIAPLLKVAAMTDIPVIAISITHKDPPKIDAKRLVREFDMNTCGTRPKYLVVCIDTSHSQTVRTPIVLDLGPVAKYALSGLSVHAPGHYYCGILKSQEEMTQIDSISGVAKKTCKYFDECGPWDKGLQNSHRVAVYELLADRDIEYHYGQIEDDWILKRPDSASVDSTEGEEPPKYVLNSYLEAVNGPIILPRHVYTCLDGLYGRHGFVYAILQWFCTDFWAMKVVNTYSTLHDEIAEEIKKTNDAEVGVSTTSHIATDDENKKFLGQLGFLDSSLPISREFTSGSRPTVTTTTYAENPSRKKTNMWLRSQMRMLVQSCISSVILSGRPIQILDWFGTELVDIGKKPKQALIELLALSKKTSGKLIYSQEPTPSALTKTIKKAISETELSKYKNTKSEGWCYLGVNETNTSLREIKTKLATMPRTELDIPDMELTHAGVIIETDANKYEYFRATPRGELERLRTIGDPPDETALRKTWHIYTLEHNTKIY
ncbi:MAG: hypothetical protein NkDv07_0356 [Candidatus Improbicoccus devescovinae]|nr:MAG: hypothetical protein NkDv07_0356 [Candidatus Improbicoccus devescovinae]